MSRARDANVPRETLQESLALGSGSCDDVHMTTTQQYTASPLGGEVPVVEKVAKSAAFVMGWNGFSFFESKTLGFVAVRDVKAGA